MVHWAAYQNVNIILVLSAFLITFTSLSISCESFLAFTFFILALGMLRAQRTRILWKGRYLLSIYCFWIKNITEQWTPLLKLAIQFCCYLWHKHVHPSWSLACRRICHQYTLHFHHMLHMRPPPHLFLNENMMAILVTTWLVTLFFYYWKAKTILQVGLIIYGCTKRVQSS